MTRISSGVLPIELCDSQLIAEHREIVRIPNAVKSGKAKVNISRIPESFRLKKGHVIFFYNKLHYLEKRYLALYAECKRRNFNVTYFGDAFQNLPEHLCNDWQPDAEARSIVQKRISERLSKMKTIRYYGQTVTAQERFLFSNVNKSKQINSAFIELI